jgi:hypothetical protein
MFHIDMTSAFIGVGIDTFLEFLLFVTIVLMLRTEKYKQRLDMVLLWYGYEPVRPRGYSIETEVYDDGDDDEEEEEESTPRVLPDFVRNYEGTFDYDPTFGDDKLCECGHTYVRHFDPAEDYDPVGCKYCYCPYFRMKEVQ